MSSPEERRHYTRVDFATDAVLQQEGSSFPIHLIDISLNGVLIDKPDNYVLNTEQATSISITLVDDITIQMKVHLVHNSDTVLGFRNDSIDMMSMSHLRRLIELNMNEANASERVLEELISSAHADINRRRAIRHKHKSICKLIINDKAYTAYTLNISQDGALAAILEEYTAKPNDTIQFEIDVEGQEPLLMSGRIAHTNAHYIGLEFDVKANTDAERILSLLDQ